METERASFKALQNSWMGPDGVGFKLELMISVKSSKCLVGTGGFWELQGNDPAWSGKPIFHVAHVGEGKKYLG